MKRILLTIVLLSGFLPAGLSADNKAVLKTNPIYRAMADEMARTEKKLKEDNYPGPYFISYSVSPVDYLFLSGTFGSLVEDSTGRYTRARVELRVGNRTFDNMNFVNSLGANSEYMGSTGISGFYDAVRATLWQISDKTYRAALTALAKKDALAKTKNLSDKPDDFSSAAPVFMVMNEKNIPLDDKLWSSAVKAASALFRKYPAIMNSNVSFNVVSGQRYFLNSEGTALRSSLNMAELVLSAQTMARDGMPISRSSAFAYSDSDLPTAQEIQQAAEDFAKSVSNMVNASTVTAYVGPVLFEGRAAGQLFAKYFAESIYAPRPDWSEFGQEINMGAFYNRLNLRVMSSNFSVDDDPGIWSYNGQGLVGAYRVDSEGVPAEKVTLVKKGKLVDFLMGRAPTKYRSRSNGHGRDNGMSLPKGAPSNLFFTPAVTVPDSQMKQKLVNLCRDYDLEYGILVKDAGDFAGNMEIYKVYAKDGSLEPLRNVSFVDLTSRALRDIVSASRTLTVYNTEIKDIPVSIVAPSVIVSEAELKALDIKPEKFPYLKHPYFK